MKQASGKSQESCLRCVKTAVSMGDVSENTTKALEFRSEV